MPTTLQGLAIFLFFIPGIVATILYQNIAEVKKPGNFDKVGIVISLYLLSAVIADGIFGVPILGTAVSDRVDLVTLIQSYTGTDALVRTIIACVLAVGVAVVLNYGWFFALCRKIKLTRRTGRIDTWHQVFTQYRKKWVRIRFADGHRLIGWIGWYAETGADKQLFIREATWHMKADTQAGEGGDSTMKIDVDGPGVFVSNFDNVLGIDILK